jgi:hypothetical protein
MWETIDSKPPGPIIMIDQSETGSSSQIILITIFSGKCYFVPFTSLSKLTVQKSWAKTILLSQTSTF